MSAALQHVLDEIRQRFVATFDEQCASLHILIDNVDAFGTAGSVATLTQVTHRLSGLAGTIGFPTISARVGELEHMIDGVAGGAFDAPLARDVVDRLQDAFTRDLARPPVWFPPPAAAAVQGTKILVAEDESDQRAIVTACLEGAGYEPVAVVSGDRVVAAARAEAPALILLDIALPGLDGFSVCRRLKADPQLAGIPVIFMTTGANLDDKLTGLLLGADEFLAKPLDLRELVLRMQHLIKRCGGRCGGAPRVEKPATVATPVEKPAVAPAVRTVVLAEDDPDVTRIVDSQARGAGYKTILAFDGEQALAAVRAHAPDALVLDLMMPKLNGFDVLTQIHEGPAPRPRIIVLSGRGREQDVMRAFDLGADDYMTKPFNPQELMARIARLIK
jgi:DNA-binding response OmpR family regulator